MNEMFHPHAVCVAWNWWIIMEDLISNTAIFIAYMWIPYRIIKTRKLFIDRRFSKKVQVIALGFAIFILACGFTHLMDNVTMFSPMWRLDAHVRSICAIASIYVMIKFDFLIEEESKQPSFVEYARMKTEVASGQLIIKELIAQNEVLTKRLKR